LRTPTDGLGSDLVVGVYAVGSNVYAATFGGVSVSTDGGSNFTNSTNGLGSTTVQGIYALGSTVYAATGGGVSISAGGGGAFTNYTAGLGSTNVTGVFATASTVYAATNGGLGISTDGGITYTNYTSNSGTNPSGLGVGTVYGVYADGRTIYAATEGGLGIAVAPLIWNTTDGTWNTTNTVWTADTGGSYAFSNGDAVVFQGTGGGVVTLAGDLQPSSVLVSATSGTYTFVSSAGNLLSGTAGLSKSGGGTLILSGSNAFTGSTSVTGGKLFVNGVLSSTTTTVATALLGGSGTVSGAVRLAAGGTIAPGDAGGGTGILTLGSLSGTGYSIAMGITGTGAGQYDQIVTTGSLNYSGGTLQLSMTGTYANGTSWDLFDFASQSGTLAGVSPMIADSSYNGLAWGLATSSASVFDQRYGTGVWLSDWSSGGQRFIFNQSNGVLTVVPEPSTFVMAGVGIVGWGLLRYRRRVTRRRQLQG